MALLATTDFTATKIKNVFSTTGYDATGDLEKSDECWERLKHDFNVADADALTDPTADSLVKSILVYYVMYKMALDRVGNEFRETINGATIDIWTVNATEWKKEYDMLVDSLREIDLYEDQTDTDIGSNTGRIKQITVVPS